jgi:acetylornithine deacetylase/succinyl-diaminopimelate desuccinylase-like protein
VLEVADAEREAWKALPFDPRRYAADVGAEPLGGERGRNLLERLWARPTLDCNGIVGGYQGEGAKTVIASSATAKISMRLVPNQRPEKVVECFRRYVAGNTPPGVRAEVKVSAQARPVLMARDGAGIAACRRALKEAFGAEPALVRNGASVPITELIQRVLKADPLVVGFGLPDDNLHAPNEHFRLEQFHGAMATSAALLHDLGGGAPQEG